jgi:SAM-dependent MidA family methyltransferase
MPTTFRDFMESALYDPDRGFYSVREQTADFYTAPELHPAFGAVLADRVAALLRRVRAERPEARLTLVEAGAGDGTLACQLARRLREAHPDLAADLRFVLVERTRKDLTTAARRLTAFGVQVDACTDIHRLPNFAGVLVSNELLDALPAHLLVKNRDVMKEVYVDGEGRETIGELSTLELNDAAQAIAPSLGEGGRHAVSLESRRWITEAAKRISNGFIVTLDYGKRFADLTPNLPRAYRAHRIESDLVSEPGTKDLTVPVDFGAIIAAGAEAGLEPESYETLSRFLIDGGIARYVEAASGIDASLYKERAQLKTLFHPEGMGESFKVLTQRKIS